MTLLATLDRLWEPKWDLIRNYQTVSLRGWVERTAWKGVTPGCSDFDPSFACRARRLNLPVGSSSPSLGDHPVLAPSLGSVGLIVRRSNKQLQGRCLLAQRCDAYRDR